MTLRRVASRRLPFPPPSPKEGLLGMFCKTQSHKAPPTLTTVLSIQCLHVDTLLVVTSTRRDAMQQSDEVFR